MGYAPGEAGADVGITRRQVLAASAAVGGAAVVGAGATGLRWWDRPPGHDLKVLSAEEYALVQAVGEAWMPPGGEPAISGAEARVGDFFDDVLVTMPAEQRRLLKLLLHALDERTIPMHFSRFVNLDLATRTEVLGGWMDSSIYLERQAVGALLVLLAMGYTVHPEVSSFFSPMFGCGFSR